MTLLACEVLVNELSTIGIIGLDSTDASGGQDDSVGALTFEKIKRGFLVSQIKLCVCPRENVRVTPQDSRFLIKAEPTKPSVSCDIDLMGLYEFHIDSFRSFSRFASSRSASLISCTSSSKLTLGSQPRAVLALVGSPRSVSTSAGRKYRGSTATRT